jgi:peptidoglycan-associated lipoprotein
MKTMKLATAVAVAALLAGCARGPIDTGEGYAGAPSGGYSGGYGGDALGGGAGAMGGTFPGTSISDRVLFPVDQTTLTPAAIGILDQQVSWLGANPGPIQIEGHADERGTEQYNIQLGARRAAAVRDFMVSRGIPDARISTNTFGRARPVATCADEGCWSQNRRAVTVVAAGAGV